MAKALAMLIFIIFLFSALIAGESYRFSRNLSQEMLGLKKEKLTHLHFYFHDIVTGRNPTAVQVAEAAVTNTSTFRFGAVVMIDDPLTVQPELSSKLVGRAQGIYASASQSELGLLMVLNFAFMEGKYNGSALSVLGRNAVFTTEVREMSIVGGSGVFRFARGYALANTHSFNTTGDAVVEYNVYVLHY